ncbi:hypothetical protein F4780DRAFT_774844 [Xylariomycetidae sp. FL0641]|nr:hypothetical protein F4780DRAFT_774844 [Xylariomycetidae sp. FL0641]
MASAARSRNKHKDAPIQIQRRILSSDQHPELFGFDHLFGKSSYYDRQFRQSPALIRARRPYLFKNAVVGTAIASIAVGVYIYTIKAIGQDEFEDVKVPEAPARAASK